ncbi:MAG: N-acetyl sugar amidotransferase [Phycisphaerales bacterium]|jgi:N-acetyl sugar amidotransferase
MISRAPDSDRSFRECTRCIMNTKADPRIDFDSSGLCNHCRRYDALISARVIKGEAGQRELRRIVDEIQRAGRGKDYDCVIGVSGGVDSTYVAYLVKKLGLRPLAIHLDNGWNSELAVMNVENVLKRLGIDLFTHVIDWNEFRDLQLSFLKASVPDGEIPTDHGIYAILWQQAVKHGVRYVISGLNFTTEATIAPDWSYGHYDWRYIRSVHRRFGTRKLRTYPHISLFGLAWVNLVRRLKTVSILNYVEYDKKTAMKVIQEELGWRAYGGKHHESIYTRFYQGYILPKKFGVDKRYGHLSDLINAGQIDRESALQEIAQPTYDPALQAQDLVYVTKKLGLSREEFDAMMAEPVRSFRDYPNVFGVIQMLRGTVNRLRAMGLYPR